MMVYKDLFTLIESHEAPMCSMHGLPVQYILIFEFQGVSSCCKLDLACCKHCWNNDCGAELSVLFPNYVINNTLQWDVLWMNFAWRASSCYCLFLTFCSCDFLHKRKNISFDIKAWKVSDPGYKSSGIDSALLCMLLTEVVIQSQTLKLICSNLVLPVWQTTNSFWICPQIIYQFQVFEACCALSECRSKEPHNSSRTVLSSLLLAAEELQQRTQADDQLPVRPLQLVLQFFRQTAHWRSYLWFSPCSRMAISVSAVPVVLQPLLLFLPAAPHSLLSVICSHSICSSVFFCKAFLFF